MCRALGWASGRSCSSCYKCDSCFEARQHATGYTLAIDILHKDLPLWIIHEDLSYLRDKANKDTTDKDIEWEDYVDVVRPYFYSCHPGVIFASKLLSRGNKTSIVATAGESVYSAACICPLSGRGVSLTRSTIMLSI